MAKTRKTSEAFKRNASPEPVIVGPTRTELRNEDQEITKHEIDETKGRLESFYAAKDGRDLVQPDSSDVPTGSPASKPPPPPAGEEPHPSGASEKPPVAEVTPPPPSEDLESEEVFNTRLDEYKGTNRAEEKHIAGIKQVAKKNYQLALKYKTELEAERTKAKELEGKIPSDETMAELQAKAAIAEKELVRKLPKWQKYDEEHTALDTQVADLLKTVGLTDPDIEAMKKRHGSLSQFVTSDTKLGVKYKNPDGTPMTEAQWFDQNVVKGKNLTEQQKIQLFSLVQKANEKRTQKESDITKAEADAKAAMEEGRRAWEAEVNKKMGESLQTKMDDLLPKVGLPAQKPVVLATDTADQKKEKEGLIKRWDVATKRFDEIAPIAARIFKPEFAVDFSLKVALYEDLAPQLAEKDKKISALTEENTRQKEWIAARKNAQKLPKTPATKPGETPPPSLTNAPTVEDRMAAAGFK